MGELEKEKAYLCLASSYADIKIHWINSNITWCKIVEKRLVLLRLTSFFPLSLDVAFDLFPVISRYYLGCFISFSEQLCCTCTAVLAREQIHIKPRWKCFLFWQDSCGAALWQRGEMDEFQGWEPPGRGRLKRCWWRGDHVTLLPEPGASYRYSQKQSCLSTCWLHQFGGSEGCSHSQQQCFPLRVWAGARDSSCNPL